MPALPAVGQIRVDIDYKGQKKACIFELVGQKNTDEQMMRVMYNMAMETYRELSEEGPPSGASGTLKLVE